jgi:hypothetical protein
MFTRHEMIMQVRELMERHLDMVEIASRLHIDITVVQSIIERYFS